MRPFLRVLAAVVAFLGFLYGISALLMGILLATGAIEEDPDKRLKGALLGLLYAAVCGGTAWWCRRWYVRTGPPAGPPRPRSSGEWFLLHHYVGIFPVLGLFVSGAFFVVGMYRLVSAFHDGAPDSFRGESLQAWGCAVAGFLGWRAAWYFQFGFDAFLDRRPFSERGWRSDLLHALAGALLSFGGVHYLLGAAGLAAALAGPGRSGYGPLIAGLLLPVGFLLTAAGAAWKSSLKRAETPPPPLGEAALARECAVLDEVDLEVGARSLATDSDVAWEGTVDLVREGRYRERLDATGLLCRVCGRAAPSRRVHFLRLTDSIAGGSFDETRGHLCRRCLGKECRACVLSTLLRGAWNPFSLPWVLFAVPVNLLQWWRWRDLQEAPADGPTAFGRPPDTEGRRRALRRGIGEIGQGRVLGRAAGEAAAAAGGTPAEAAVQLLALLSRSRGEFPPPRPVPRPERKPRLRFR